MVVERIVKQGFKMLSHVTQLQTPPSFQCSCVISNNIISFKLAWTQELEWTTMFIHKNTVCYNYSLPLNNERNVSIFKGKYFLNLMCLSFVPQRQIKEVSSILSKFPSKSKVAHVGGYVSLHEAHKLCPSQHETPWFQIWGKNKVSQSFKPVFKS